MQEMLTGGIFCAVYWQPVKWLGGILYLLAQWPGWFQGPELSKEALCLGLWQAFHKMSSCEDHMIKIRQSMTRR